MWITLHYISSQLYGQFCTHLSFMGFLVSPFIVKTPYCIALRWCINKGADSIDTMWIVLGIWLASFLIELK